MSEHDISLTVNGTDHELTVEARTLLVHALREELDYTGPKVGCETGTCGACTVELDGDPVKSCTQLAVQADGGAVTTAGGLADGDDLHPIQQAFHEEHGLQCGYCTPGMVMTAKHILENADGANGAELSREMIRGKLKGNVCRCTGYHNIVDAVETAADAMTADGGAGGEP